MGFFKRYEGKRLAAGVRKAPDIGEAERAHMAGTGAGDGTEEAPDEAYTEYCEAVAPSRGPEAFEASEYEHDMTDAIGHLMEEQRDRVMAGMGTINECYIEDMLGHMVPKASSHDRDAVGRTVRRYGDYLAANSLAERLRPGAEFYHEFWTECLVKLLRPDMATAPDQFNNPAFLFTKQAKQGKFDDISDAEYKAVLDSVEKLANLWRDEPYLGRQAFVDRVLQRIGIPYKTISDAAWGLELVCMEFCRLQAASEATSWIDSLDKEQEPAGQPKTARRAGDIDLTPAMIYDIIDKDVQGQADAKRIAAMLMYHHLHGNKEHVVIAGPSGCGKSEIWRVLAKAFPGRIRMVDTPRLASDGWRGSMHVEDIFNDVSEEDLAANGLIVVFDEADKMFCETIVSGNGTDHGALVQTNLLKMMDGDVLDFNNEDRKSRQSYRADCSKVSVVMLGTFEVLLRNKANERKGMGFGSEIRQGSKSAEACGDISSDDLIKAGMRREIAGRVDKVAMVRALDKSDYAVILDSFVLPKLSGMLSRKVGMTEGCKKELIDKAVDSKLGVRWMRSRVLEEMDERIFRDPAVDEWEIESMDL